MSLKFAVGTLIDTLDRTLGQPAGYDPAPAGPAWDPATAPVGAWRIPLLDDEGEEVGSVVADLGSVVLLGGSLIMLPESSMREQVADRCPSSPVLEAYAEVVNVLRSVINNIHRNPHVVPGRLGPYDEGADWQAAPTSQLDLVANSALGPIRLAFLGR